MLLGGNVCPNPIYNPFSQVWKTEPRVSKYYTPYARPRVQYPFLSDHNKLWLKSAPKFYNKEWEKGLFEHNLRFDAVQSLGGDLPKQAWADLFRRNAILQLGCANEAHLINRLKDNPSYFVEYMDFIVDPRTRVWKCSKA